MLTRKTKEGGEKRKVLCETGRAGKASLSPLSQDCNGGASHIPGGGARAGWAGGTAYAKTLRQSMAVSEECRGGQWGRGRMRGEINQPSGGRITQAL